MIVVTGATGQLGQLVVEGLVNQVPVEEIAVVVRDAAKAARFGELGVEVRVADYNKPSTLADAFNEGEKVLLVEDVVTTGLSSREAIRTINEAGGEVIAAAALVDRTGGEVDLGVPFHTLVTINFPSYAENELPPELAAKPAVKPGSRK